MAAQSFRRRCVRWGRAAIVVVLVACGGGTADETAPSTQASVGTTESTVTTSTVIPGSAIAPSDGCADGTTPQLASFDAQTGAIGWVSCSADLAWRTVLGATEEVVIVGAASAGLHDAGARVRRRER